MGNVLKQDQSHSFLLGPVRASCRALQLDALLNDLAVMHDPRGISGN
jgi:hypothetical protein